MGPTGGDDAEAGSQWLRPQTATPRSLRLPPVPALPSGSRDGRAAAVLPSLMGAATGVGFSLVAGDARYLLVSLVVAALSVGTVLVTRRARRAHDLRRSQELRTAYLDRVAAVAGEAAAAARDQRAALEADHPPPGPRRAVHDSDGRPRRPGQPGFGALRVGVGAVDALVRVEVAAEGGAGPAETSPADPLAELARAVAAASTRVPGAPVVLPTGPGRVVAVVGDPSQTRALVRAWLVGAAAGHSAEHLGIEVATAAGPEDPEWAWARWLPHAGAGPAAGLARAGRAVGRVPPPEPDPQAQGYRALLVVDGVPLEGPPAGRTAVLLCPTTQDVPSTAATAVTLRPDGTVSVADADGRAGLDGVVPDRLGADDAVRAARTLAAAADPDPDTGPSACGSYHRGPVRLRPLLDAAPGRPLAVPLGLAESGVPLVLDLAEAAAGGHGPHGLVVGATGSGKSELLRTLVLGLAAARGARDVSFLLVDFKGGSALDPLAALPHVTGLVTNLEDDPAVAARVQDALEGELDDRQRRLRAAGVPSVTELRATFGGDRETFPWLVVVVDEFGELLELRPQLLDTFTRVGRLGRSLGVHLLLASQRLDEGRLRGLESHLRYRVALRTFTAAESLAVLGTTAAHGLPPVPGAALLGVDGSTTRFQAATTSLPGGGADAGPVELARRLHGPDADPARAVPPKAAASAAQAGSELDLLVRQAAAAAGRPARPMCLPPLPRRLALDDLADSSGPGAVTGSTGPHAGLVLGIADDPRRRRRPAVRVDLGGTDAHVAVAGRAGSGRSTFLWTLAWALAARYDPSRWQVLALDLGGGMLTGLRALPHTAAVATGHDHDGVRRVADEVEALAAERAAALATAGVGSFADLERLPTSQARAVLPDDERARLLLLVDDCGRLRREHPDVDEALARVAAAGRSVGIHLGLSCTRWLDVRAALLDAVDVRLELGVAEPGDSRWDRERLARVPPGPGGGLSVDGLGMRLAMADGRSDPARHPSGLRAPAVRTLPREVHPGEVPPPTGPLRDLFLLGVRERRLEPVLLDPSAPGAHLVVLGDSRSGRTTVLNRVARHLAGAQRRQLAVRMHVVDPARSLLPLADHPRVVAHAYEPRSLERLLDGLLRELSARLPPAGLDPRRLAERTWWTGPEHVLVIDDHDLVTGWGASGGPGGRGHDATLSELAGLLPAARDIGLHVVLARPVTGLARASYDPFLSRLRECTPTTLVLAGDRSEGPVAGEVCASPGPPGRGRLVRTGLPSLLVQCCLPS